MEFFVQNQFQNGKIHQKSIVDKSQKTSKTKQQIQKRGLRIFRIK